jgi:hypothetical protein
MEFDFICFPAHTLVTIPTKLPGSKVEGNKGKWKEEGKMEQEQTLKYVLHRKNVG